MINRRDAGRPVFQFDILTFTDAERGYIDFHGEGELARTREKSRRRIEHDRGAPPESEKPAVRNALTIEGVLARSRRRTTERTEFIAVLGRAQYSWARTDTLSFCDPTGYRPSHDDGSSDQPGLAHRGGDEIREQRMRIERLRLQFRMILHADEPGMTRQLDDFRQDSVRRHAAKP
jgi:hypothetical protein